MESNTPQYQPHILVVDDELQLRRLLKRILEQNGYKAYLAESGNDALVQAGTNRPELVILDLGLPDMDGIAVLKKLREWTALPVLILSVRNSEEIVIEALDAGADDYLSKPFRTGELLARVRALLRHRSAPSESNVFTSGTLSVDTTSRTVKKNDEIIKLTPTEYSLLLLFIQNAGKVLTQNYILQQVWGPAYTEESQYLRVFIAQLRKKLEDDPAHPHLFLTESSIGYRMAVV